MYLDVGPGNEAARLRERGQGGGLRSIPLVLRGRICFKIYVYRNHRQRMYLDVGPGNEAARLPRDENSGLRGWVARELGVQLFKLLHKLLTQRVHLNK